MNTEIIVALIASAGGILGAFVGVIASAQLTTYRIQQLEKKVEKHNTVIERTYTLEENQAVMEDQSCESSDCGSGKWKGGLRYADKRLCKTGITGGGARAVFYWNVAETERNGKRQVYPINKWRYRRADLRDLCLRHLRVFQWSGYCSGCVYGTDAGRSCSRIIHLRKSAFKTIK